MTQIFQALGGGSSGSSGSSGSGGGTGGATTVIPTGTQTRAGTKTANKAASSGTATGSARAVVPGRRRRSRRDVILTGATGPGDDETGARAY